MAEYAKTHGDQWEPTGPIGGGGGGRGEAPLGPDELTQGPDRDWLQKAKDWLYETGGMSHKGIENLLGGPASNLPLDLGMGDLTVIPMIPFRLNQAERARQRGDVLDQVLSTLAAVPIFGGAIKAGETVGGAALREGVRALAPKAGKRVVERTVDRQSAEEVAKQKAAIDAFLHGREHPINRVGGSLYEAPPATGRAKAPTKHSYDILEIPGLDEIQASAMRNPLERSPTSVLGLPPYSGVPVDQSGIDALLAEAKAVREGGKLPAETTGPRVVAGTDTVDTEVARLAQEMQQGNRDIQAQAQRLAPTVAENDNLSDIALSDQALLSDLEGWDPRWGAGPGHPAAIAEGEYPKYLMGGDTPLEQTMPEGEHPMREWFQNAERDAPKTAEKAQAQIAEELSRWKERDATGTLPPPPEDWILYGPNGEKLPKERVTKSLRNRDPTHPAHTQPMSWSDKADQTIIQDITDYVKMGQGFGPGTIQDVLKPSLINAPQLSPEETVAAFKKRFTFNKNSPEVEGFARLHAKDMDADPNLVDDIDREFGLDEANDAAHYAAARLSTYKGDVDRAIDSLAKEWSASKIHFGLDPMMMDQQQMALLRQWKQEQGTLRLPEPVQNLPKVREAVKPSRFKPLAADEPPMRLFTGTAADPFEKFDPNKWGVGEGGERTLDEGAGTYANPLPPVARHYGEQNAILDDRATRAGRAMVLDVRARPSDFLDIEAKFSALPDDAKAAIQKRLDDWLAGASRGAWEQRTGSLENNWQSVLHQTFDGDKRKAAEWLRDELGYKGFKYLDSGSSDITGQIATVRRDVNYLEDIVAGRHGPFGKDPAEVQQWLDYAKGRLPAKQAELQKLMEQQEAALGGKQPTYNYVVNDPDIIDIVNQDIGLKAPQGADQINEIMRQLSGEAPGAPARWQGPSPNRSTGVPRYVSPKGTSPRMQRLQDKFANDPALAAELNRLITAGGDIGRDWYNAEAIRDMFIAAQGNSPAKGHQAWIDFIDRIAATSTGSKVPKNIDITMDYMGRTTPKASSNLTREEVATRMADEMSAGLFRPSEGAGSKTQRNHQWNIESILRGEWNDATADPRLNPKPRGYRAGFMGDPDAIAADMHYTRMMAMLSDDPAWLAVDTQVGDDFAEKLLQQFPGAGNYISRSTDKTGAFHTMFRARDAVNNGAVPFEAIKTDPQVWEAMPADAEYGPLEEIMKTLAHGRGLTGYQGQAGLWIGAADKTGVDPTSRQTFTNIFIDRVNEASQATGVPVEEIIAKLAQSGEMRWAERGLGAVEMPHEQIPLTSSGHLTGAADDSLTAKREFTKARSWKDKSTGRDILTQAAGMPTAETMPGMGVWTPQGGKTEFNAVETARPLVPLTDAGLEGATIDPAALDMLEQVSAVRGLIDVQGGEAYFRLFPGNDPATSNSILIPLNRMLSKKEAATLNGVVQKYGLDAMSDTGRATTMMSFDPTMNASRLEESLSSGMATDIQAAVPGAGRAVPATRVGDMYSLENELAAANEGTGVASTKVAQRVSPETAKAITQSEWWPSIKETLLRKNAADVADAKATGRPLRQDVIRMRKYMADHGLDKFLAKVIRTGGKGFPAIAGVAILNEVLQELERPDRTSSPDG